MNIEDFFSTAVFNCDEYLDQETGFLFDQNFSRLQFVCRGRVPSKKNSRITQRSTGRSFPSKDYVSWHESCTHQILMHKIPRKHLEQLHGIVVFIFFPDERIADMSNKVESVMDLMVDTGIIKNDNWKNTGPLLIIPKIDKGGGGFMVDLFIRNEVK